MEYTEKMQSYMEALEEERRKILVFQRELPLCLELVTQAIETCKQQLSGTTTCEYNIHGGGQSECNSEQTSTEGPVLEEFIPIKGSGSRSDDMEQEQEQEDENNNELLYSHENPTICCSSGKNKSEKSDWLRSAQLWNQTPDPPSKNVRAPKRVSVVEVKRNGGAFQPFHRDRSNPAANDTNTDVKTGVQKSNQSLDKDNKPQSSLHTAATSSTAETVTSGGGGSGEGGSDIREEKGGNTQRKQRRCWSPELHRRFLQALQQLGGSHAATPKQIRELMKVDGLTNDEVKSHLQKYRLHTRRPSPTIHQTTNPPPPQFVVVGGIWMPHPEYAAVTGAPTSAEAAKANGIYAPVGASSAAGLQTSSVTQQPKSKQPETSHSEGRDSLSHNSHSHSGGRVRCNSPSTSSSTHTSTASPVY